MFATASQLAGLYQTLTFFQGLVRAGGPAFSAAIEAGWTMSGRALGLRGNPRNEFNSLMQHSRPFVATSPLGEQCLGLFVRERSHDAHGALYLAPRCVTLPATFRLEMPSSLAAAYPHCRNPLEDDALLSLTVFLLGPKGGTDQRHFSRLRDFWKAQTVRVDDALAASLAKRPAEISMLGALRVTQPFDCSDIRYAPSPWARFVLQSEGLEGAAAARMLGMNWFASQEDKSFSLPPGSVMTHGPL